MNLLTEIIIANGPTFTAVLYFAWKQLRRLDKLDVAVAGHGERIARLEARGVPVRVDLAPTPVEAQRV